MMAASSAGEDAMRLPENCLEFGVEYVIKFIGWRFEKKNPCYPDYKPYDLMSFEREAYDNEHDVYYPKTRKHFSWIKYI